VLRWITRLVLLFALGLFAPGEAAARVAMHVGPPDVAAQKLVSWGSDPETAVLRQAATRQAAETQQAASSISYDFASGCLLAAERTAFNPANFADDVARIRAESLARYGPGEGITAMAKLSGGAQRVLGNLSGMADNTIAAAIRARGGSAANIARLETGMGQRTLAEVAEAAARGDAAAVQAIKMVKQAATKGQRY